MKTINLKELYPYYTQDSFIEVSDEIADLFIEFRREEVARQVYEFRHKAYYSLEYNRDLKRGIGFTPEQILEQREFTRNLYYALNDLSDVQAHRIYLHFFYNMSVTEIAVKERVKQSAVSQSILCGIKNLKNIVNKL